MPDANLSPGQGGAPAREDVAEPAMKRDCATIGLVPVERLFNDHANQDSR